MATKQQLATANILEYKKRVELGLQQEKSKLRQYVTEEVCHGEASAIREVFEPSEGVKITGDLADTVFNNTNQKRRWISFENYGWAERIDSFATLDSEINPFLPYAKLATSAMHRLQDSAILEGMLGVNKTGQKGNVNENFDTSQIIPADTTADSSDFFSTFIGQLIKAKAYWRANEIDVDNERLAVGVPSDVWLRMFALERATSKDYVSRASLEAGKMEHFAGFWFIPLEKVPGGEKFPLGTQFPGLTDAEYDDPVQMKGLKKSPKKKSGIRYVLPCWCASGVVFSQRKEIEVKHSENPDKWHAPQLTVRASFGATRVEPKKVLGLEISEASLGLSSTKKEETKGAKAA